MAKLDDLKLAMAELEADVEAQTTVTQSAVTLLEGLSQQLQDVANDATGLDDMRQRLQNLNASLDTERDKLAQAVVANTPAVDEEPVPEPEPPVPVAEEVPTEGEGLSENFGSVSRRRG